MQDASHTFNKWFNTAVVGAPVAGIPTTSATSGYTPGDRGNAPKVNYYLPGDTNFDTALFKNIPIENKMVVQFRLETYNTFNHAEFNSLNNTATFATAASKTTPNPVESDATFGQLNGTLNPRYLQLALRVNF
jgi:hypothetical protein